MASTYLQKLKYLPPTYIKLPEELSFQIKFKNTNLLFITGLPLFLGKLGVYEILKKKTGKVWNF